MIKALNKRISRCSFRGRFLAICAIALSIYLPYSIVYFKDEASFVTQLTSCTIHIFLLWLTAKHLYPRGVPSEGYSSMLGGLIIIAILINFIPFIQPYTHHDNGFFDMVEKLPQTNFGLPHIYLRVFPFDAEGLKEYELTSVIFYPGTIFSNAFKLSLFISLILRVRYYFQENASLWSPRNNGSSEL